MILHPVEKLLRGKLADLCADIELGPIERRMSNEEKRWVAVSGLQKSIRRGYVGHAIMFADALVDGSPEHFWGRLPTIALEDIGPADYELCALIVMAVRSKVWRDYVGERRLARYLVERATVGAKSRALSDAMWVVQETGPRHSMRRRIALATVDELVDIASDLKMDVFARTGAVVRIAGAWWPGHKYPSMNHGVGMLIERCGLTELEEFLFRRAGKVMRFCYHIPVPVFASVANSPFKESEALELPHDDEIDGIPACSYDYHTRIGKKAFRLLCRGDDKLLQVWKDYEGRQAMPTVLFMAESERFDSRFRWPDADEFFQMIEAESLLFLKVGVDRGRGLVNLVSSKLPELHDIRKRLIEEDDGLVF